MARETKREIPIALVKNIPYPLVPSKKERECYFARFLDIFKKLEITIPFGEALQQMPMYKKFLMDLLTKKGKYINNESVVVKGNCDVVTQRILPQKFKDPGSVTIPCSCGNKAFQVYFDDAKNSSQESSVKQVSRIKESFN